MESMQILSALYRALFVLAAAIAIGGFEWHWRRHKPADVARQRLQLYGASALIVWLAV